MMIQERDWEILSWCYRQRFLLMSHVERYFFKESRAKRQVAARRIQKLGKAGLIRRDLVVDFGNAWILRLTPKGVTLVRESVGYPECYLNRVDPNTLNHDALVTSVALRLNELWDGDWIARAAIEHREFSNRSDGLFVFRSGKLAAIEVEDTIKGRDRFEAGLREWCPNDVLLVLYVATTPSIHQRLRSYLEEGSNHVAFGLVTWEELKDGKPYPWSAHGELDLFNRRSF